jgi:invasion protein IalB
VRAVSEGNLVMNVRTASGSARSGACTLALVLTTAALTLALASAGFAQTPPAPTPKAQPKPKGSPAPKANEPPQQQAAAPDQPQLLWSPWTKFCIRPEEKGQQVCLTGRDGRLESGFFMIGASLVEPEGAAEKILRVMLPLGMAIQPGTRVIVDQGQPLSAPYTMCSPEGCAADYEASAELIDKLKKGQRLVVQGMNYQGRVYELTVPLAEFAKANEGTAVDPTVFSEQQRKLQEDLQRRAEEARKKLEKQPATR